MNAKQVVDTRLKTYITRTFALRVTSPTGPTARKVFEGHLDPLLTSPREIDWAAVARQRDCRPQPSIRVTLLRPVCKRSIGAPGAQAQGSSCPARGIPLRGF